jgi:hypothetical protein
LIEGASIERVEGMNLEQDGETSWEEAADAFAADGLSNRSKCPSHTPVDDQSWSASRQGEESSKTEGEMSISDALGISMGDSTSPSDREPDARSHHEESNGLKPPPSEAEENEAEPASLDCGSPEHRSTQDECIGAATSLEIWVSGDQAFESSQEATAEIDKIPRE